MYSVFGIASLVAISVMVNFACTEKNGEIKQYQRLYFKTYSTLGNSYSSGNAQNGGGAFQRNFGNIHGRPMTNIENNRNRKQVTGYYNPYNTYYNNNNKIPKYRYQPSKRLTPQYRPKYNNQANRKQDFGFGNIQRTPRPTRKTNVTPKRLKPLLALM